MILASWFGWVGDGLLCAACVGVGYGLHVLLTYFLNKIAREKARAHVEEKTAAAQEKIAEARRRACQDADQLRRRARREIAEDRETLKELERRLKDRGADLREKDGILKDRRAELDALRRDVKSRETDLRALRRTIRRVRSEGRTVLLGIVGQSEDTLRQGYLDSVDAEVRRELSHRLEQQIQTLQEEAEARARDVVDRVVQRMEMSHARDERPAAIAVPDPSRLEAAGLKPGSPLLAAFQEATGVAVSVDREHGVLSFDTLDGVRREVARRVMSRILGLGDAGGEGRTGTGTRRGRGRDPRGVGGDRRPRAWNVASVRALVERAEKELRRVLTRRGRKAAQALKLSGNNRLFEYLGRLNYRTSFGQNILRHSQEVGFLGGMLGAEAGFDGRLAKRCSFLHDLGKCIDYEVKGGHPEIGGRLARESGESEVVVNAIEAHHDDVPRTTLFPLIVQTADAISGARPGARRRAAEKYLLRMGQIEEIANAGPGVESAYVIQAGREVRVILAANRTSDADAAAVADRIARELEAEMSFPGTIKVTVIREKKVSAVAS